MYLQQKLSTLKKLYLVLILSLLVSCLFGLYAIPGLASAGKVAIPKAVKVGLPVAIFACLPIWMWANKLLKKARNKSNAPKQRAGTWVTVKWIQGLLLTGLGLLGLVATVISRDHFFLLSTGFMAGILIVSLPNEIKLQVELKLSTPELEAIKELEN